MSATSSSPSATTAAETQQPEAAEDKDRNKQDADLQRAKDLLALHAVFKSGGGGGGADDGLAAELRRLRAKVAAAVGDIGAASREEEAGGEDEEGFENWD